MSEEWEVEQREGHKGKHHVGFTVQKTNGDYLHQDGKLHYRKYDSAEHGKDGWFPNQQAAQTALDKYLSRKPCTCQENKETETVSRKDRSMFKKALHRIVVVWCLYGLVKLCIFVNPLMFGVWAMVLPKDDPPILGDGGHTFTLWCGTIIVFATLALAGYGIHRFSDWFFNTSKK